MAGPLPQPRRGARPHLSGRVSALPALRPFALAACGALLAASAPPPGTTSVASLAERGLWLLPSPGWTPEVLEDLAAGLDALPPGARRFPGGPLEVQWDDVATPWGLGDEAHPLLTDGTRRLHLSRASEDDDARALARLKSLSSEKRTRLWRRRAVVHAVVRRWDERLRWSQRAGWRRLSGWSGEDAALVYAWAFSRRAGQASAALDLATFAEELLVSAESLAPAVARPDEAPRCLDPSKARFLDERLAALDPGWQPARDCPAFEAWARLEQVRGAEVLFAAPSGAASQALFGHVLLRVVREDDGVTAGGGLALQLAALVSPFEPGAAYVWRGLTGGFRGVFAVGAFDDVRFEALGLEQRSLRRFTLSLTEAQRRHLLERLWELERIGYLDYRFFTANCAAMLRFVLAPVLGDDAPAAPLTPWESPSQVLDALAPWLAPVGEDEASASVARRASEALRRAVREAPSGVRARLGGAVARLEDGAHDERRAASAALLALLGDGEVAPEVLEWVAQVALAVLRRERAAVDQAMARRIRTERATLAPGARGPTTEALVASRQRRFELGTTRRVRAYDELTELLALDALLRDAPRRPFTASEQVVVDEERSARQQLAMAADLVAAVPEAVLARALERERADQAERDEVFVARGVPEGGQGHAFVGGGATSAGDALARLRLAGLLEEWGDQRWGGLSPRVGLRLLDAHLEASLGAAPTVHRAGFVPVELRVVTANGWGWGAGAQWAWAAGAHELTVAGEGLLVVASNERLTNALLAVAGVRAGARVTAERRGLVAPRGGLEARLQLPGSFANAVRVDAAWTPRMLVDGAGARVQQGVTARSSLVVRLGVWRHVGVAVRVDGELRWLEGEPVAGQGTVGVTLD